MIGPEQVTKSLLAAIRATLPGELATIRTNQALAAQLLPPPREWHAYEEARGTWDSTRSPLLEVFLRSAGSPKRARRTTTSDTWQWEYSVRVLVVLHAATWAEATWARDRYILGLRETFLKLAELDDAPVVIDLASIRETHFTPIATNNGTAVQADVQVEFGVTAFEDQLRALAGRADSIWLYLHYVPVDGQMPPPIPNPLPDPIEVP